MSTSPATYNPPFPVSLPKGGLPPDYHMHTPLCKHASGTPSEYRATAKSRGLPEICFTDHVPTPDHYDEKHRMGLEDFPTYRSMIEALQDDEFPPVLFGIEADYYEGCERFLTPWLQEQAFDVVLGSVHYLDDWCIDNPDQIALWEKADVPDTWRRYFIQIARLARTRLFDMVGHIDVPKKFGFRITEQLLKELAAPVLDTLAECGMGFEINSSGLRRTAAEQYPSLLLLSMARERNIPIVFGSDAHRPSEVGAGFEHTLALARAAGYTEMALYRQRQRRLIPLP